MPVQSLGLGAFILLDYTINHTPRDEHAVVLLSGKWDSLYDLLNNPGAFVEAWRQRYTSTPQHNHGGTPNYNWKFSEPISIRIESLTGATTANYATLAGLARLYPGILPDSVKIPSGLEKGSEVSSQSHAEFARETAAGAANPANWKGLTPRESEEVNDSEPFKLAYVAEFALLTRTLTIRYIPQDPKTATKWFQHQTNLPEDITAITVNRVAHTDLHYLHFDIGFEKLPPTKAEVADKRARFLMDFLVDPQFINGLNGTGGYLSTSPFLPDDGTFALPNPTTVPIPRPRILNFTDPAAPSAFADSVWADPSVPGGAQPAPASPPDPVPEPGPLCVVLNGVPVYDNQGNLIGYMVGGVLVKMYAAFEGGG